jgi:hypothetical protein
LVNGHPFIWSGRIASRGYPRRHGLSLILKEGRYPTAQEDPRMKKLIVAMIAAGLTLPGFVMAQEKPKEEPKKEEGKKKGKKKKKEEKKEEKPPAF